MIGGQWSVVGQLTTGHRLLVQGQEFGEYVWSDVRRVHVLRPDPIRRDFSRLVIELGQQQIVLALDRVNYTTRNWQGATAEQIDVFMKKHVPEDGIHEDIAGEPLELRVDVEQQLETARKRDREGRCIRVISLFLFAGCFAATAILLNWAFAGWVFVCYAPLLLAFLYYSKRMIREGVQKLKAQLSEMKLRDQSS